MNKYTNQTAFTKVCNHLMKQMEVSIGDIDECLEVTSLYRGPRKLKCAIGVLIMDKDYKPSLESQDVYTIMDCIPYLKSLNGGLLTELMYTHDMYRPKYWAECFRGIADKFNLRQPKSIATH